MKYIGHLSLIGILLFAIACQPNAPKEEQEDKIFSRLFAQYRQSDRLFRAEAGFSAGDSLPNALPIELSTVTFQGGPMSVKQSADNKTVYKTERQGNFQEIIKFKCTMASGKKVAIDLDFDPIESFLIKDKISKNSGFTIVWKGLPLSKDESLLFLFADKDNKAASTTLTGPTQRTEIFLEGAFLKDLQTGSGNLFLVRKKKGVQENSNHTAFFELEYYTSPLAINILP